MRTVLLTGACVSALVIGQALAGGVSGGNVVYGNASIGYGAKSTTISQSTQKALINWNSFSVASGSSVSFLQPNASSITLNRVLGASPSVIDGSLFATGNVWLINSSGVLFGKGSQINVGGLIATTSDMRNSDFISGNYNFSIASPNPNAAVVNQGTIKTARGGTAILAGSSVDNQGLIQADLGNVVLAGASTFSVDFTGDNLLRFAVVDPVKQTPKNSDGSAKAALVSNSGTISANGGHVLMTARAASNVVDNVVNNTGMIEATSVSSKNGEIVLDAGDGTVEAGGTIDASGTASGESGGSVKVLGKTVQVADGTTIDASGANGGGSILIGGNFHGKGSEQNADTTTIGNATIKADALQKGNGGKIAVWSNKQTVFNGTVSAKGGAQGGDGGYVETSGGNLKVGKTAKVDTLATHGKTGTWLLDPENIDIISGGQDGLSGSEIDPNTIVTALNSTNVELEATNDINIDSVVAYSSANAFTLLAGADINAKASVQNGGAGAINLIAGWDGTTTDLGSLTNTGVYGNNGGSVLIGTDAARGDVSIGSFAGTTTVAGANIVVDAEDGIAQIGYHGAGGGNIDVLATANVVVNSDIATYALIGNGGSGVTGSIGGDISVTTFGGVIGLQSDSQDQGNFSIASIGNLGGNGASESGNIAIDTNGGALELNAAGARSFVRIGNWTRGDTSGTSSGNIAIDTGVLVLDAGFADQESGTDYAEIGNGSFHAGNDTGALSGDISINAASLIMDASGVNGSVTAQTRIGNLGYGDVSGDLNITTASDLQVLASGGGLANIGSVTLGTDVTASGDTTVLSGGGITLAAQDGGEARIEAGGIDGTVSVTAQGNIVLSTENDADVKSLAFIGNFGSGGNVTVTSRNGSVELLADSDGGSVQIGNNQIEQNAPVGGDVTVVATHGNIEVSATGDGAFAEIGNNNGNSVSGDVSVLAGHALQLSGGTQILIGNLNLGEPLGGNTTITAQSLDGDVSAIIFNDLAYGDFALNLTGTSALVLPVAADYASVHALSISNGGDIVFDASLQNAGTGDITIASGGNVLIGGQQALGGVAVGSFGGTTTITGTDVVVEADNGYAQIGYNGAGNGAINVIAGNGVSVLANTYSTWAQIGNGTYTFTGNAGGDISVSAGGAIEVLTGGNTYAQIGNGGLNQTGNSSGNISIGAASILVESAGANSTAHIGNAALTGNSSGDLSLVTTAGDIDVITSVASAGTGAAAIGTGLYNENGIASGDLTISAAGSIDIEDHSPNSGAWIGNDAVHGASGTIDIAATGQVLLLTDATAEGSTSYAFIGTGNNNVDGTASGDISITASAILLQTESQNATTTGTHIGNGGYAQGTSGGNITLVATSGDVSIGTTGANAFAWIGNWGATITGDIAVQAASGSVTVTGSSLIGNQNGDGISESGNVTIGAQSLSGLDFSIGQDLPGGDVTLNVLSSDPFVLASGFAYSSSHALTVNAAGDVDIEASLQNSGTGNITVTSGGTLIVGGANAEGDIAVGSFGGTTTITGTDVILDAEHGYAQIGFAGDGGTGDIDVSASHDVIMTASQTGGCHACYVQIGNGGVFSRGTKSGDITVTAGHDIALLAGAEAYSYAQIGNGGDSGSGDDSGTIALSAGATLTMTGFGDYTTVGNGGWGTNGNASGDISIQAHDIAMLGGNSQFGAVNIGNGGEEARGSASGDISVAVAGGLTMRSGSSEDFVQIGNGAADGSFNGTGTGNIFITVGGSTSLSVTNGGISWLGNFVREGSESGDLTLVTGSLDGASDLLSAMFAADLGTGDGNGGNVTIGMTGESDAVVAGNVEYSSSNTLSILSASNVVFLGSLQNDGSGAINVVAGWNGTTLDPAQFTSAGVFGNGGGSIVIGGDEASGNAAVGSAHGTTTLAASDVSLLASNGYAQVGYHGAGSGDIAIDATGDIVLTGGSGAGTYAQIGHGGAGTDEESQGYALSGDITLSAVDVTLAAGTGSASYAQIGHGGFMSGSNLAGQATIGGDIAVTATGAVLLTGNGNDAYAQIGNGGDQVNSHAGAGSSASIGGDITVVASDDGGVTLAAGSGANAYAQIGNGGFDINGSNGSGIDGFTIAGNISVSDLILTGGDTGANAFAQVGNGDASSTGFANVSGDIMIASNGTIVLTDGKAANSPALIGNAIGTGTVTGTVTGFQPTGPIDPQDPIINGVVATTIADNNPADLIVITGNPEPILVAEEPPAPVLVAQAAATPSAPLAALAGENVEGHTASDTLTLSVATSLGKSRPPVSRVLLGGALREFPNTANRSPHGVPSADQEFSSWGNEALWQ